MSILFIALGWAAIVTGVVIFIAKCAKLSIEETSYLDEPFKMHSL